MSLEAVRAKGLLVDRAWIGGQWCEADSGRRFPVFDPASGERLAEVPDMGEAEARRAIAAAAAAFDSWRQSLPQERAVVLSRWAALMRSSLEELATLVMHEQGKPLAQARGEVAHAAAFVEWFAEEGKRIYGEIMPTNRADRRFLVLRQPVGVCAAITPWNFPASMITRKVAPALAVGCTVVVKPAEQTPLTALALARLAEQAGMPPGVLDVVTGADPAPIGLALTSDPRVRKISFTGSTEVGRLLMAQSAATLKRLSLELGGDAPFLVFDDADVEAAVQGAIASKYRNSGQTCVCANRILVQEGIYDAFVRRYVEEVGKLAVGPGWQPGVTVGPLIDEAALDKVEALVADAREKGARLLCGGRRAQGLFYTPTALEGITPDMRIAHEEIFGPVAPIYRFETEEEGIALANASDYGLAGYLYARDVGRILRVAEALEVGVVGVNTGSTSNEAAPFGGIKQSGFGREGSKYGVEEYLELKSVCLAGL